MKIKSEAVVVEARFSREGEITPRLFIWRGTSLVIEGVGRRWREGGERCFAILAAGGRAFELRMDEVSLRWRVTSAPILRGMA